jgi:hypothetical protein
MELPHHHPSKEDPPEVPRCYRVLSAINATARSPAEYSLDESVVALSNTYTDYTN